VDGCSDNLGYHSLPIPMKLLLHAARTPKERFPLSNSAPRLIHIPNKSYRHDLSLTKRSLVVTLISKPTITSATRSTLWRHFSDFCQAESSRTQTKSRGPHRNISLVVKTLKENENKSALRISMLTLTYITFWTHQVVALLSVRNPISIN
jgi:hypothetical protein